MSEDYVGFYVRDIEFRSVVVLHQTPLFMCLSALLSGYVPSLPNSPFTYCDICCGDGTTLNALAYLNRDSLFYGIDFNPQHIKKAKRTAEKLGLKDVTFIEASISEVNPEDFPLFDFITINGAYSWLEDPVREKVLAFVSSRLKERGLFYVEYMALPGRISIAPMWKLIQLLVPPDRFSSSRERGKKALELVRLLAKRGMFYLQANPPASRAVQFYLTQTKTDEYFVDHFVHNALASGFRPMFFYEIYRDIQSHGLEYVGSSDPALNDLEISVPPPLIPTFFEIKEVELIETVKDFIRNTMDRRDLFSKNPFYAPEKSLDFLKKNIYIVPLRPSYEIKRTLDVIGGYKFPLKSPFFDKSLRLLEEQNFLTLESFNEFSEKQILKGLTRLLATGDFIVTLYKPEAISEDTKRFPLSFTNELNKMYIEEAEEGFYSTVLISEKTGGAAIVLAPLEVIFLKVLSEEMEGDVIERVQLRLQKVNKPVQTPAGNKMANSLSRAEIEELLDTFIKRKIPILKRLAILS